MASDIDERFLTLETKVAYQEKLIAELNEVLLDRGRTIDLLERRMLRLERTLREGPDEPGIADDKPPHY